MGPSSTQIQRTFGSICHVEGSPRIYGSAGGLTFCSVIDPDPWAAGQKSARCLLIDKLLNAPDSKFASCESARTWSLVLGFTRRGDLGSAMRKVAPAVSRVPERKNNAANKTA
jgi:hypothetical protein